MQKSALFYIALLFSGCVFLTNCIADKSSKPTPEPLNLPTLTIAGLLESDTSFSYLVIAFNRVDLMLTVNGRKSYTLFAPTNAAFRSAGMTLDKINTMPLAELASILKYHLLDAGLLYGEIPNGYLNTLADGPVTNTKLSAYFYNYPVLGVRINDGAAIIKRDILATNGVIHTLSAMLRQADLYTLSKVNLELITFEEAVSSAALAILMDHAPGDTSLYTVFAPTDNAFTVSELDLDAYSPAALSTLMRYHVVSGNLVSSAIIPGTIPTLNNATQLNFDIVNGVLTINSGTAATNNARIVSKDAQATNGVLHVINRVLMP